MKKILQTVFVAAAALCATGVSADTAAKKACGRAEMSPVAVSLLPALEAPRAARDIIGLRVNLLAGRHHDVSFLDVGTLANLSDGDVYGLQVAGLWNSSINAPGVLQCAGGVDLATGDACGAQIAALHARTDGAFTGLQLASIALAGEMKGLQIGVINRAEELAGLQIGLVNYAQGSDGIQLGVVNVMPDGRYPVMPVFNIGF